MKAATASSSYSNGVSRISIHAAREGGDTLVEYRRGMAAISIHAAREGGDALIQLRHAGSTISIHAAREGGDVRDLLLIRAAMRDFNPRRP